MLECEGQFDLRVRWSPRQIRPNTSTHKNIQNYIELSETVRWDTADNSDESQGQGWLHKRLSDEERKVTESFKH